MRATLQRSSWPLLGSIAILAAACFVQLYDPHAMPTPGKALAQQPSAKAWRGHVASQHIPPALSRLPAIDPVLMYSTFLGGPNFSSPGGPQQQAYASFVDGPGNVYVTGPTDSPDFPVTPGVVQTTNSSGAQISFLTKINPAGTSLVFSTYLNLADAPVLAVDASGNIFVGGNNQSFPIPSGTTPFQATAKTANSILIVKLNSTATTVLSATYLGGSGEDFLSGLAVDAGGNLYVSGSTTSNDFPTKNPFQAALGSSGNSSFLTKLDPTLSTLLYSTYLGQASGLASLAVDASENAYVVGQASSGFPVTSGALQATCGGGSGCGTLAKLNPSASGSASLLYATYLGGTSVSTIPAAVAVDSSQNVYISGYTANGFPEINSLQSCAPTDTNGLFNNAKGFVAEVNAAGALVFSSCLGNNTVTDVVVDGSGTAYVTGSGDATLPLTNPIEAIVSPPQGAQFVAAINASAGTLLFSSFVSGVQSPNGVTFKSVGVDSSGNIVATGISGGGTNSAPPFPIFNAFQPSPSALGACTVRDLLCTVSDAIIVKISPTAGAAAALTPATVTFPPQQVGTAGATQTVTIIDMGSDALTVSNATVTGDFSIQNGCTSVAAAGGTCAIQVNFTPTMLGTRTGTLTITDSSAGSPRTVELTGQGAQASATLSPASLSFPDQQPGTTSSAQTVILSNSGALALQISSVQVTGPFGETNNCGSSVNATNGSCTISVTFSPTTAGAATGTLTITDGAPGSPQTVSLTGTGKTPSLGLAVASGGSASATVSAGATATYALSVGGAGMAGTATLTCTGAPTGAACSVPVSLPLSATTASSFNVSVSTTARSLVLFTPVRPTPWFLLLALLACMALLITTAFGQHSRRWRLAPLMALVLYACGGGSTSMQNPNGTSAGTYTLVVTAKSGSTTQMQNLTLNVN
jgi:hypothetical protein